MTYEYRSTFCNEFPAFAQDSDSLEFPPFEPGPQHDLIEVSIRLSCTRAQVRNYLYSKLYYCTRKDQHFSEDRVVCFLVGERNCLKLLYIALPTGVIERARQNRHLRLRIDGLPYSQGSYTVESLRLVYEGHHSELARKARLADQRQWVRKQVIQSEYEKRAILPHYPESLSIELTSLCNLHCPHCSSHGMHHLHRHHNLREEMPVTMLSRLADEAFSHATAISIVGRETYTSQ